MRADEIGPGGQVAEGEAAVAIRHREEPYVRAEGRHDGAGERLTPFVLDDAVQLAVRDDASTG